MTIKESLQTGAKLLNNKNIQSASIDAEILLLYALDQSKNKPKSFRNDRIWLYAHNEYALTKEEKNKFYSLIKRREKFEPIAYITGKKEFYGLEFYVDKNVLIPRPETEIIVEEALKEIITLRQTQGDNKNIVIADVGTGSGAIAVSIAKILKNIGKIESVKIHATDISAKALKIAKINASLNSVERFISFKKGNLLKALPKNTKIDFLLANLPYVGDDYYYKWLRNGSAPAEFHEIKHEPKSSLLAKNNGLGYFNEFFPSLPQYITDKTKIFLESDPFQIPSIKKLAKKHLPKHKISVIKDLRGLDRITKIEINQLISS